LAKRNANRRLSPGSPIATKKCFAICPTLPTSYNSKPDHLEKLAFWMHKEPKNASCGGNTLPIWDSWGGGLSPPVPPGYACAIENAC